MMSLVLNNRALVIIQIYIIIANLVQKSFKDCVMPFSEIAVSKTGYHSNIMMWSIITMAV